MWHALVIESVSGLVNGVNDGLLNQQVNQMAFQKNKISLGIVFVLLIITCLVFSVLGDPILDLSVVFSDPTHLDYQSFWLLRLPRVVLAAMIGAALSVAGVTFQALLRNPLADPYILGVSGGAALGYVLAAVIGLPFFFMPLAGYVFALLALFLIYNLASQNGVLSVVNLLLVGIVFNSFSFALILVINSLANFGQAQQILYLLLGSVDPIGWSKLAVVFVMVLVALVLLLWRSQQINLLSLGDDDAHHLGLDVNAEKKFIFVVTSLLVGASVSLCGLIGFVGLIVPHLCRLLFGADHRRLLPAAALVGALLLIVCDFAATNAIKFEGLYTKLPVGAVTALIGAPFFVYLLKRNVLTKAS